jgi:hypothetical protein
MRPSRRPENHLARPGETDLLAALWEATYRQAPGPPSHHRLVRQRGRGNAWLYLPVEKRRHGKAEALSLSNLAVAPRRERTDASPTVHRGLLKALVVHLAGADESKGPALERRLIDEPLLVARRLGFGPDLIMFWATVSDAG